MKSVFEKHKNEDFKELVLIAKRHKKDLDAKYLYKQWLEGSPNANKLIGKWLESLETGEPDFSVYGEDDYLNDLFICWKSFSRRYLMMIRKFFNENPDESIKHVLDMGCGVGYTTIALSEIFPDAIIYGENLKDTLQYQIMKDLLGDNERIKIVDEKNFTQKVKHVDFIFGSDFFEHIQEPIDMLILLLETYMPKYFVFANSFTTREATGHFKEYYFNNEAYSGGGKFLVYLIKWQEKNLGMFL